MTENRSNTELLNIEDFSMCFDGKQGVVHAVQGVSLTVRSGEIAAIVGESGSGKTALCFSILMLHITRDIYREAYAYLGKISLRWKKRSLNKLGARRLR